MFHAHRSGRTRKNKSSILYMVPGHFLNNLAGFQKFYKFSNTNRYFYNDKDWFQGYGLVKKSLKCLSGVIATQTTRDVRVIFLRVYYIVSQMRTAIRYDLPRRKNRARERLQTRGETRWKRRIRFTRPRAAWALWMR